MSLSHDGVITIFSVFVYLCILFPLFSILYLITIFHSLTDPFPSHASNRHTLSVGQEGQESERERK